MRRGLALLALTASTCVTTRDAVGVGDSRIDEPAALERAERVPQSTCGIDGRGDVVVLDGRTGGPLTCLELSVTSEPVSCLAGSECPTTIIFRGKTNRQGQVMLGSLAGHRVTAVADGFAAVTVANKVTELELMPLEGYWLKVLDIDGNYLPDVSVAFKQGEAVIAQLRTNALANVIFSHRQPFSGEPVVVEASGYLPLTVTGVADLGDDGHTLVLRK